MNTPLAVITTQALPNTTYKQRWPAKMLREAGKQKLSTNAGAGGSGRVRRLLGFMLIHYSISPCDRDKDQHVSK